MPVGNSVATVARSTPSCRPSSMVEPASIAPVLPAEMNASDVPVSVEGQPDHQAGFGFLADGRQRLLAHADDVGRLVDLEAAPVDVRDGGRARPRSPRRGRPAGSGTRRAGPSRASTRPGDLGLRGALSPPIASSATRITLRRPRPRPASCRRSSRRNRTPGAAAWASCSAGRPGCACRRRSGGPAAVASSIFEVRRFGTAMMSSSRFGGSVTGARPRVQVGPAAGAESGAVVPAEQQVGMSGERQFLPHDLSHVHGGGALGQG